MGRSLPAWGRRPPRSVLATAAAIATGRTAGSLARRKELRIVGSPRAGSGGRSRRLEQQHECAEPGTGEPALPDDPSGVQSPSNDARLLQPLLPSARATIYLQAPYTPLKLQTLHFDLLSSSTPPQQFALNQPLSFVPQFSELYPHTILGSSIPRGCPSCSAPLRSNPSPSQQLLDHAWR